MKKYSNVAKLFLIIIMILLKYTDLKAQDKLGFVIIDYYDPQEIVLTSCDSLGYSFDYLDNVSEIVKTDSATYSFFLSHIESLVYAKESDGCHFPNVRQRIVVEKSSYKEYVMIFSDGVSAMEKNGRCVLFDEELQRYINDLIEWHIAIRKKKTK